MKRRGLLITTEGGDGSGKSSLSKEIYARLLDKGYNVELIREPGGTEIGEKIRNILLDPNNDKLCDVSEALLYAASRAQLVNEVILPKLNDNTILICDRYIDSSIIYQGICRNLGVDFIKQINRFSVNPDLTFVLSLDYNKGMERLKSTNKNPDRLERDSNFIRYVYDIYNTYTDDSDSKRLIKLDSNKDFELVVKNAMDILAQKFYL